MMKKVLIFCSAGMSSSLIAKQLTDAFKMRGQTIEVEAVGASTPDRFIETDVYDLYLVSPQTRMYFDNIERSAQRFAKPTLQIPPQSYVPVAYAINDLANLIQDKLK